MVTGYIKSALWFYLGQNTWPCFWCVWFIHLILLPPREEEALKRKVLPIGQDFYTMKKSCGHGDERESRSPVWSQRNTFTYPARILSRLSSWVEKQKWFSSFHKNSNLVVTYTCSWSGWLVLLGCVRMLRMQIRKKQGCKSGTQSINSISHPSTQFFPDG